MQGAKKEQNKSLGNSRKPPGAYGFNYKANPLYTYKLTYGHNLRIT